MLAILRVLVLVPAFGQRISCMSGIMAVNGKRTPLKGVGPSVPY